jgi:predicted metal-dependent hydrolase
VKKADRVADLTARYNWGAGSFDPHYQGYFEEFNAQRYYEAHDILEQLWLETEEPLYSYYKGLIQVAGAFVHMQKGKLNPAARLLRIAEKNLTPHGPMKDGLDVDGLLGSVQSWVGELEGSNYKQNPYDPKRPPQLVLTTTRIHPQ